MNNARRIVKIVVGVILVGLAIQMGQTEENRSSAYLVGAAGALTLVVNAAFLLLDRRKP